MSKKATADSEPSNALIMRTLTHMNSKFDKLPTVEHLNCLKSDLHSKLEANTTALRQELRDEFRSEMDERMQRMTEMIGEVRSQIGDSKNPAGRNNNQMSRYLRARRSFKIWPITVDGPGEAKAELAVRKFFIKEMSVPQQMAMNVALDAIHPADQARNSKITMEYVVIFGDVEARDAIKSYASGLAASKGMAGLRLDIPPCLKGSFKILNEHGIAMVCIYGHEVKRNIKFDDRNTDLMMDIKLPTSSTWHNISIEQATEAKKARDKIDIQNIRHAALGGPSGTNGLDQDKARALMLAFSPDRQSASASSNFKSTSGVVHINTTQDWRNFESEEVEAGGESDSTDKSIEEILSGWSTRNGGRRKNNGGNTQERS